MRTISYALILVLASFPIAFPMAAGAEQGGIDDLAKEVLGLGNTLAEKLAIASLQKLGAKIDNVSYEKGKIRLQIKLSGTKVRDEDMASVKAIKDVYSLDVSGTQITDAGLAQLKGHPSLAGLVLQGSKITDASLPTLQSLTNLAWLEIDKLQLSEATLATLRRNTRWLSVTRELVRDGLITVKEQNRTEIDGEKPFADLIQSIALFRGEVIFALNYRSSKDLDLRVQSPRRLATTYYHRKGPVGQVLSRSDWFRDLRRRDMYAADFRLPAAVTAASACFHVLPTQALAAAWSEPSFAVIGLNAGTHASYGRAFQHVDFFTSDLVVKRFSLPGPDKEPHFFFVHDALERGCNVRVFEGKERDQLKRKGPRRFYQALFVEATRSELKDVATDLLTREAIADFMDNLAEEGVLAFHISHRDYDLAPLLAAAAHDLELAYANGADQYKRAMSLGHYSSNWLVIARKREYLSFLVNTREGTGVSWNIPSVDRRGFLRDPGPHDLTPWRREPLKK